MIRKLSAAFVAASVLTAGVAGAAGGAECDGVPHCVHFATLAPPQSPWGQWFRKWKEAAEKKGDGKLKVVWHWNGTQGPEPSVVSKIKTGQLWGAAVTAVGLAQIYGPINALQMPGAFKSWQDLDEKRNELRKEFDPKLKEAGFFVSGWGDVGRARTMSIGFPIRTPADLAGKTPAYLEGDKIAPKVYEVIGGVTPKPTEVISILPLLTNKTINVLTTPALAAEQLQWTSRLDHLNTEVVSYGVGAMVISQAKLDSLPQDMKVMMQDLGDKVSKELAKEIRKKDDEAFERAKKKMTVYEPTEADKNAFKAKYKAACLKVSQALASDVLKRIKYCD